MSDKRVVIEGMWEGSGLYSGTSLNPLPVMLSPNPGIKGAYIHSIANVPGTVAAQTFVTLFNPVGSGKLTIAAAVFISSAAVAGTTISTPVRVHRVSTAPTGGVTAANADFFKLDTTDPNPSCVVKTGNPLAVLEAPASNTPPPMTTGVAGGQFVHEIDLPSTLPVFLREGEGIAIHAASGDASQRWNISITWAEI